MMIVTKDRIVSLTYELRLDNQDGDLLESIKADTPLTFLYGSGKLLPKFEENLKGLAVGDEFEFQLEKDDAYGNYQKESIINVPVSAFEVNGKVDENLLKKGNTIPMQDRSGNRLNGIVVDVTEAHVSMDFNHPLAGKNLHFTGNITNIREATEEELTHGHAHQSSCDCSNGDGGCGCH